MTQSFQKNSRLLSKIDFLAFFTKGVKKINRKTVVIFYLKNSKNRNRLGITIKLKCTSIERNKIKRTVREWFRKTPNQSIDINVVFPKDKKVNLNYFKSLKEDLNALAL